MYSYSIPGAQNSRKMTVKETEWRTAVLESQASRAFCVEARAKLPGDGEILELVLPLKWATGLSRYCTRGGSQWLSALADAALPLLSAAVLKTLTNKRQRDVWCSQSYLLGTGELHLSLAAWLGFFWNSTGITCWPIRARTNAGCISHCPRFAGVGKKQEARGARLLLTSSGSRSFGILPWPQKDNPRRRSCDK